MSNIGIYTIDTKKKYIKLSELIDVDLVENTKYLMQVQANDPFYFCVDTQIPEKGEGFKVGLAPFTYTPMSGNDLYVCTFGKIQLNIAM